jgi:hypothetical protein
MRNDVANDVGVAYDIEKETPIPIDPRLPTTVGFVVFLGLQRRMAKILFQKRSLFEKSFPHLSGRILKGF